MMTSVSPSNRFRSADLLSIAKDRARLEDLGDDGFRANLERLLQSINEESRLTDYGVASVRELLLKPLVTRLRVEQIYRSHPEIDREVIVAPSIGVGLPRTGSTLLGFLMGLDPQTRSLRYWESVIPYPPMLPGEEDHKRIADADLVHKQMRDLIPEILPMTPYDPRGPAEDFEFAQLSFDSNYALWVHCPSYMRWYTDPNTNHEATYVYHRRVLRMLQWRWRNVRWSLRCPLHSFMLKDLSKVYPDAKLIMTHRDQVITSISFQNSGVRSMFLKDPMRKFVGPDQLYMWQICLERIRAFRCDHPQMFVDVLHEATTSDPTRALRMMYADLGWNFTDTYEAAVLAWRDKHPRVVPKINPADYGLDERVIAERLGFYLDDPVLGFSVARARWAQRV
jgi:hypothetical protein